MRGKAPQTASRTALRAACHGFIAAVTLAVWLWMVFRPVNGDILTTNGLTTLGLFTVLSNLLNGAGSAALLFSLTRVLRGKRERVSRGALLLKYIGLADVGVTFLVILLFLGPAVGHAQLYRNANFWFHLVLPVFSAAEFLLWERDHAISLPQTLLPVIPIVIYGLGYTANLLINGYGPWPDRNDIYGFATWGIPIGLCIFALIALIGWLCALLLRLPCRKGRNLDKSGDSPL